MTLFDWFEFASINFLAGAAIAIDASILVLVRFRDMTANSVALKWAGAIGLTHTAFPMVGFVGGWLLIEFGHVAAIIYPTGAGLLIVLIVYILRESTKPYSREDETNDSSVMGSTRATNVAFWAAVMAVSYDAFLSGPGKNVILERYPGELAWLSFLIVGLVVTAITLFAGLVSRVVHNRSLEGRINSPDGLAQTLTIGILCELSVFSFFLIWSVARSVQHLPGFNAYEAPLLYVLLSGFVLGGSLSVIAYGKIKEAQGTHAVAAISHSQ